MPIGGDCFIDLDLPRDFRRPVGEAARRVDRERKAQSDREAGGERAGAPRRARRGAGPIDPARELFYAPEQQCATQNDRRENAELTQHEADRRPRKVEIDEHHGDRPVPQVDRVGPFAKRLHGADLVGPGARLVRRDDEAGSENRRDGVVRWPDHALVEKEHRVADQEDAGRQHQARIFRRPRLEIQRNDAAGGHLPGPLRQQIEGGRLVLRRIIDAERERNRHDGGENCGHVALRGRDFAQSKQQDRVNHIELPLDRQTPSVQQYFRIVFRREVTLRFIEQDIRIK